jgi:hypothetical protein
MNSQNKLSRSVFWLAVVVALLLMVPLVAMRFSAEVKWTAPDFVVAGVLLFGSGLTYLLVARRGSHVAYRFAVGVAVLAALMLVWVNLAVGIIGAESNRANLMYLGVLAVEAGGAIVARLRPGGMARALLATAFAQLLVAVIAVTALRPTVSSEPPGLFGFLVLNAFFAALFAGSALLFRQAARQQHAAAVS